MSPPSATAGDILPEVDPEIWRACAGASVQIPTLNSRVYYFPQGHVEHCCSSFSSSFTSSASPILCLVSSVELLADPVTDEVFAHLHLQPMTPDQIMNSRIRRSDVNQEMNKVTTFAKILTPFDANNGSGFSVHITPDQIMNSTRKVTAFAKILTPSDANNGGGFSVPRFCVDSVFPRLDFTADPPFQKLYITDIHGFVWDFRHIYRGTPRRHLLTTGWSKFVNSKKLIAGDSVVFMTKSVEPLAGQLFIGVRRTPISSNGGGGGGDEFSGYYQSSEEDDGSVKKFRRSGKGKLTAKDVSEAINKAVQGLPFEVVYYPTSGWSDFVVRAEDFEASMSTMWCSGIKVKMAMEAEDSSKITWFQGTVSSILQGSPWKQLQITWDDEPEILQNMQKVNPWQVQVDANSTQFLTSLPPIKRLKFPHCGGEEGGDSLYSTRAVQPGDRNPFMFSYTTTLPVGIQGARHYESASFNQTGFNPLQLPSTNNFFTPESGKVSNFSSPPTGELSPNSNITDLSSGNRDKLSPNSNSLNRGHNSTKGNSIQLFGKIITVQEVPECGLVESGLNKEDKSKETINKETQLSLKHGPQEPVKSIMCKGCESCRNLTGILPESPKSKYK